MGAARETPLLEARGLSVFYGALQALWAIDIEVGAGECVAVIGANGAGKSSLIAALMGAARQKSGVVRFAGNDISRLPPPRIAAAGLMIVPEGRRLFASLSIEENILVGAQIGTQIGDRSGARAGGPGSWTLEKVYRLFPELVPIRHIPGNLASGGQQQMAALARALMSNPKLILCDEVSLGLAPAVTERIYALFPELCAEGVALMIVEQETRRALKACDRFYCLLEGRVSLSGRSAEASEAAIHRSYFGVG